MTAASSGLGLRPGPALRGFFGAFGSFAARFALALAVLRPPVLRAAAGAAAAAARPVKVGLRRFGNLDAANSKFTLPASASHFRCALNGRRVRIETKPSSRSVL